MKNFGIIILLLKLGPILLKLFKSAKVIKVSLAAGSMAAYSYLFTWEFAIILLASIVFHEYGHITGMKNCGMKTKGIYLIPFFGGAAVPEEGFKSRKDETYIALMGPWYGLIMCIPFLIYFWISGSHLALGLVSFMALINLFNLIPINPMDGGRVLKSLAFSINSTFGISILIMGLLLAITLIYIFKIWLLLFIVLIGSIELFIEVRNMKNKLKKIEDYTEKEKLKILNDISFNDSEGNKLKSEIQREYINELKQEEKDNIFKIYIDKIKEEELPKMEKKDIISYSLIYIALSSIFIGLIFYTGQYPEVSIALNVITDKG